MKARWLWTSWAYLALAGVVALEVGWISFTAVFLVPKFQMMVREGWLDRALQSEAQVAWMPPFLNQVSKVGDYTTWIVLLVAGLWGLFEWRVRSDNKPFMRLSALGTAAAGLIVVIALQAASLVIPLMLAMPPLADRSFALNELATIDLSVDALEQALTKRDWETIQVCANRASQAADALAQRGAITRVLAARTEPRGAEARAQADEVGMQFKSANASLREAQQAIQEKDATRLATALRTFHAVYDRVRETVTKPVN